MLVLFDASVYISALRAGGTTALPLARWAGESPIWLSSVVLEELYAGASGTGVRAIEKLEKDFDRARRILVPNLSDWSRAGRILAQLAQRYGYEEIGRARMTNDALIAVSAGRFGITVITANARDFSRLAEFCPLQWQVRRV